MKKLIIALSLLTFSYVSQAQKVGIFNSTEVMKDLPEIQQLDTALNIYLKTLQAGFTYLKDEYEEKSAKLKDTSSMSDIKKNLLKEDVANLVQKLNSYQNDASNKLQEKRAELLEPFTKKLKGVVREIAKVKKLDIVIDEVSTPIYYGTGECYITDLVKAELKKVSTK